MKYCLGLLSLVVFCSCSGKGGETKALSHTEKVKLEQYMVAGQQLYMQHCSACHQAEGQGLAKLFPPLKNSDYLNDNVEGVVCVIKNGLSGEIVVNGVTYNQPMPALPQLTSLEIAEIATYLYNSWGRSEGVINVKEVEEMLEKCEP
ncbi:c-type cytochrome [Fulvivirga imtechensis]|nr:cytochrome c [Fulvivirga imtechensis]